MDSKGFDSEEREFQRDIQAALGAGRAWAGACPEPDLLMAARAGVVFEGAAEVERHIASCPICEQLSRDLADYEFPPATESLDRRIRNRADLRLTQARRRSGGRYWLTAAALIVMAGMFLLWYNRPARTVPQEIASQARPDQALALEKASIKIPAADVLTFRGDTGDGKIYLADLAAALEPYRKDDYAAAADALGLMSRKYPGAAEPAFYLGVSELFLNRNEAAINSFEDARRRGSDTLRGDISWYLAIAFSRTGRMDDARRETQALCANAGEYQQRACAAVDRLR